MPSLGDALVLAQDLAMVACAGANATYFFRYWWRAAAPARRLGAAVLVLVNLGVIAEGTYFSALYAAYRLGVGSTSALSPAPWFMARLFLFLGTAAITVLVVRQWRHR